MPRRDMERDDKMGRARILLTFSRKKEKKQIWMSPQNTFWNGNVGRLLRKGYNNYFPSRNLLSILLISWVSLFPLFWLVGAAKITPSIPGNIEFPLQTNYGCLMVAKSPFLFLESAKPQNYDPFSRRAKKLNFNCSSSSKHFLFPRKTLQFPILLLPITFWVGPSINLRHISTISKRFFLSKQPPHFA